jgi:hypothetical protein
LWKEQSPSPEKKPSPDETAAALTAIAKIPDQLNPLAAINEKLQRPLLVSVSGKLDEKPAQNGDADVLRRVGELETKVQTLENWRNTHDKGPVEPKEPDSPIVISKDLFSDDAPIVRKLGTISDALAKIEVAINKKKFPEIQIPKPAPVEVSIRTIGWSKTGPTPHKSSTP